MGNLIKSTNIFLSTYGLSLNCDPKEAAELICSGIVDRDSNVVGSFYKAKDGSFCIIVSSLELGSLKCSINLELHDGVKTYCFDSVLKKKTHCFDEIVEQMKITPSSDDAIMPKVKCSLDYYKIGLNKVRNNVLHFNGTNTNYAHSIKTSGYELSLNNPGNEYEIPLILWILKTNGDAIEIDGISEEKVMSDEFFVCKYYNDRNFGHPRFTESFDPHLGYTNVESIYTIANDEAAREQEIKGSKSPIPPKDILKIVPNISRMDFNNKESINILHNLLSLLYCSGETFIKSDLICMFGLDLKKLPNAPTINNEGIVSLKNASKPSKTIETI